MKLPATSVALIALVTWIGSSASAAEPRVSKYQRYDAGDYVIVSSRGNAQARRIMEDLAKFRVTLERALGKRAVRNQAPTTIIIASDLDWKNWLQPRAMVAGYFQQGRFSNRMAIDGDETLENALAVIFHEYTHYYLATQFAGEYPPWFNEGLAELMGYAKFEKGQTVLRIPMGRVYEARDGDWIPFERMIKVDHHDAEYQSHRLMPSFYAQSWLTLHYGMVENREFGRQIIDYLNDLNRLTPQDEAISKAFGADLSQVDARLKAYSRQRNLNSGAMALGEIPPITIAEGKPISEVDTLSFLAGFLFDTRQSPERVRPLVEALERRDPNKARAAIHAARLAQRKDDHEGFDAAVARAEAALAPGDWEQRRELATALLDSDISGNLLSTRSKEATDADLRRALKWFGQAITVNNQDVESLWGFGTAASRLDQHLDLAEQALIAAYRRSPTSADIAVSLANIKSRQQKPDEMIPYLEDVLRYATDLGTRRWATETLDEVQKWLAERDQEESENRRKREEYEKALAEYEKKYGRKKK